MDVTRSESSPSLNGRVASSTDDSGNNRRKTKKRSPLRRRGSRSLEDFYPENQSPNNEEDASAQKVLECPICNEHMVSLFQLNQHLDDAHSERNTAHSFASHAKSKSRVKKETAKEADENDDDVRDSLTQWFKKTQKNFQKMSAALLDLPMESPDSDLPSATSSKGSTGGPSSSAFSGVRERVLRRSTSVTPSSHADPASPSATPSGTQETPPSIASLGFSYFSSTKKPETHSRAPSTERGSEPGITKAHWQRESASDMCSEFTCNKSVGIIYGKLNCYLCGRLFCDAHCRLHTRVNAAAKHDPVNGIWSRVCEKCYKGREGYSDTQGATRDWTGEFNSVRKIRLERILLDFNLLERRIEKLCVVYSKDIARTKDSAIPALLRSSSAKDLEKSVVPWESDHTVKQCPICATQFTLLNRKHHCRLCGRVICGDPRCSGPFDLPVETTLLPVFIKVCQPCQNTVSRRKVMSAHLGTPLIVKHYDALSKCKADILQLLPLFNDLLMIISERKNVKASDSDYKLAISHRKALIDLFSRFDETAKKIKRLTADDSPRGFQRLQDSIYIAAIQFLQDHMFTLQLLPSLTAEVRPDGTVIKKPSTLEEKIACERILKEIAVLEEQYEQVRIFLVEATSRRRFEDAQMLKDSLDELAFEITLKRKELETVGQR